MDIVIVYWKNKRENPNSPRYLMEDKALTKAEQTYEQLIVPLESQIKRSIWRIIRDPTAAQDVLQDALVIIWKKLERIRKHPNPRAFILKICINAAYDHLRKQKPFLRYEDLAENGRLPASDTPTAPEILESKKLEAEILKAISLLPRKIAIAMFMRIIQGQTYAVIADALNCREVTARSQVSKGRVRLLRRLAHLKIESYKEDPL